MFVELGPLRSSLKPIHIPSAAPPPAGFGLEYKSFFYARISISLNDSDLQRLFQACLDGGCGMSLIDEGFRTSLDLSTSPRTTRFEAVSVQGIGAARHASHEFVSLLVSCPARDTTDNSPPRVATFRRDFHIVPDLPCKVLLGNDIAATEELIVDFGNQTVTFPHCGSLVADISLYRPNTTIATIPRLIQAAQCFVVPPQSMAYVPIATRALQADVDYEFVPFTRQNPLESYRQRISPATLSIAPLPPYLSQILHHLLYWLPNMLF
ncbi:hypothetical protein BJ508DRAFT_335746 [Ascobolus immersus RN42]|uniref:Uncharacterized protein n=1 Tax=Ascobolus immersus RN42 TaxID=1160509 RepID=A0A3N4HDN3_ASCIM|nr:hypothetical protein BJ508DRAFT_335746 [Ascobolus immersus RN42]